MDKPQPDFDWNELDRVMAEQALARDAEKSAKGGFTARELAARKQWNNVHTANTFIRAGLRAGVIKFIGFRYDRDSAGKRMRRNVYDLVKKGAGR